jgi:F-type H+-transporting ATPase subunit delta
MAKAAKEYAKALYSSIENADERKAVLSFLRNLSEAIKSDSKILEQIKTKSITDENVKKTMSSILEQAKIKDLLMNFFNLLVDKGRMDQISEITEHFQASMDSDNGILRGVVKSALNLSSEKRIELEERFAKKLDKRVILTYQTDERVVGGVRVEVGPYTFDDTIETHIKKIKENLNRSSN